MAYDSSAHVTLGQLKTSLQRTKADYAGSTGSGATATDTEVAEMLNEVFGAADSGGESDEET